MKIVQISDIHWRGIARHAEYTNSFSRLFEVLRVRIQPDLIINTGDTFHTKTHGITPEIIERLTWMFRELATIAPTIHILGNHDGNLTNSERIDVISPIHEAVNHPRSFLYKNSQTENLANLNCLSHLFHGKPPGEEVLLHVYSPFDKDGWRNVRADKSKINLALFHGSVYGSITDGNFSLPDPEADLGFFRDMDFAMLGDIHRQQFLASRPDKDGVSKPWMAYPGSLIQQNFGEDPVKGFLVWDIRAKNDWDCKFVPLRNYAPFLTVSWTGDVASTLKAVHDMCPSGSLPTGSRVRINSSQQIQQIESRQLVQELRAYAGASEVLFKYDIISNMESIDASGKKVLKTDLRHDYDATLRFYRDFLKAHQETYALSTEQTNNSEKLIRGYLDRFNAEEVEQQITTNTTWSVKKLEFDNIFRYGAGNSINFESLSGVVGIFGPNKTGKSSAVGALMYGLFNSSDRGNLKGSHIINRNKKMCNAKVTFSANGNDYLVERETARNIPKKNPKKEDLEKTVTSLNLYKVLPDGSRQDMNSISREDTDKEIRKLIGSSQDFLMTALSNQGGAGRFIDEGATQRKAILGKFLDLDIFEKLYGYAREDFILLNEKTKKYNQFDWSETLGRLSESIKGLEAKVEIAKDKIEEASKRKEEIRIWMHRHQKDISENSPQKLVKMRQAYALSEKKLLDLLKNENVLKEMLEKQKTDLDILSKARAENNTEILLKKMAEIETLRASLATAQQELALGEETLKQQKKSVKKLEVVPCGDSFPTCQFIKDSHLDKKKIGAQEKLVTKLVETTRDLEKLLAPLLQEKIAEKLTHLRNEEKREAQVLSSFHETQARLTSTSRDLLDLRKDMSQAETEIKALEALFASGELKEYEKNQLLLDVLTEDHISLENQYRELLVQLGGKTEQYRNIMKEKAECRTDLELLKTYDSIQNAFSKNGIPAMVLKTQLPTINFELSRILEGFVDFKVSLETDTTSNVMDIYIEDAHSRRIIEVSSGMEKMISSLALRVALINLSSLPRSDMFIVDEGWGTLDSENLQRVSSFLTGLRAYFKTILIISHIQEIKEAADEILEIKNNGSESFLTYPHHR